MVLLNNYGWQFEESFKTSFHNYLFSDFKPTAYFPCSTGANNPFAVKVVGQNQQSIVQRKVNPGQSIKIKLLLSNNSSKNQHISVTSHTAFTGDAGIIQYNLKNPGSVILGMLISQTTNRPPKNNIECS
ncbi:hypothetical protein SAC12_pA0043 (plasmid) [Levilactobacillus brevis]|nr:hypothetical protein SAC12_pA0043 [Levilactobacillus brevis]